MVTGRAWRWWDVLMAREARGPVSGQVWGLWSVGLVLPREWVWRLA
jgi:hypothetical protein